MTGKTTKTRNYVAGPGRTPAVLTPDQAEIAARIRETTARIKDEQERIAEDVAELLAAGAIWQQVADALGVTRASAHARYRHLAKKDAQEGTDR